MPTHDPRFIECAMNAYEQGTPIAHIEQECACRTTTPATDKANKSSSASAVPRRAAP